MRTNSGSGEGTNNNQDPTLKEHEQARGKSGEAVIEPREEPEAPQERQETTGLGSNARKHGQEGDDSKESPVQPIR